jgi:integrase
MAKITKALVEGAKAPQKGQLFIRDDELKGFALRITASGTKSFVWEGRVKNTGRMCRIALGSFPLMTVVAAREAALAAKAQAASGADPVKERKAVRAGLRAQWTFGRLTSEYLERHAKPYKLSWREDRAILTNHIPIGWNARLLSDFTREDVVRLRDRIKESFNSGAKRKLGGPYAANHVIRLLRAMFNLAKTWGFLSGENPAGRIKLLKETSRDRYLSADELRRVNHALDRETNEYWRAYFALSLLLGTRKRELLCARWADIDIELRTWRIPKTKAGRPHLLPLPESAVSILESLPSRELSEWIFPGSGSTGHLAEPKKAWQRIRTRAGVPDVRIHDLRRTLGSWLSGQGYNLQLIGKALNHSSVSTTQIYAKLDINPLREALERNARLMFGGGPQTDKPSN